MTDRPPPHAPHDTFGDYDMEALGDSSDDLAPVPTVLAKLPERPAGRKRKRPELPERYSVRAQLGEGGMGEVLLCTDWRIGREVALKLIRSDRAMTESLRARFEREVRIQGQLEHPSVVPVYDFEESEDGHVWFSMKRVRGQTLEDILLSMERNDVEALRPYSRRKLVGSISDACMAVAYAHSRGVIHRDLKPANIMLGDFGEVYVLDWGLAKLMGETLAGGDVASASSDPHRGGETVVGQVLGTLGYMAPEQAMGESERVGPASDVYALGAILFELLTLRPLHEGDSPSELMRSYAMSARRVPSEVAPHMDISPELDEIVLRATAEDPRARFASTRDMHDALEAFLYGDRDSQRRREFALEHLAAAEAAGERFGRSGGEEARRDAIGHLTKALAMDPGQPAAQHMLVSLLVNVPKDPPREAMAAFERTLLSMRRRSAKNGAIAHALWMLTALGIPLFGVRDWFALALIFVPGLAATLILAYAARSGRVDDRVGTLAFVTGAAAIAATSMVFGPLIVVPALAASHTLLYAMQAHDPWKRIGVIGTGMSTVLVPLALELSGVLPRSFAMHEGTVVLYPRLVSFETQAVVALGALVSAALVATPAILVSVIRDAAVRAERRAFVQNWHLQRFLPDQAQGRLQPDVTTSLPALSDDTHG